MPWGLQGDRRWAVVDDKGEVITARTERRLLSITVELEPDGSLVCTGPHAAPLRVPEPRDGQHVVLDIWKQLVTVTDAGPEAASWLGDLLGRSVRLVWLDDPTRRSVDPQYGRPTDRVSLADAYPLLLTTEESLRQLNTWIAETAQAEGDSEPVQPLPMRRFRPNVVVGGATPFIEDHWKLIRIGEVTFRVTKGCDRCVMTTIDPLTLAKGKEPLRTLAKHRQWDGKVWFGINLIPDGSGTLHLDDPVEVLATV